MLTLRHILFPYDFSIQSGQAAPFVRALAKAVDARISMVTVVPPWFEPGQHTLEAQLERADGTAERKETLQSRLDRALTEEFAGLQVERIVDGGDPAIRIADIARARGVDLIMMPTHGLGLFRRGLIGSVTAKVLHDAACPVWTAAHAETQTAAELPRRILCAVDRTAEAPAAVRWAADFGAQVGARLQLLHVVDPLSDWPWLESERRLQQEAGDAARRQVTSMLTSIGVDAPCRVAVGDVAPTVIEEVRQEKADLLIIGRGSLSEPFGRLRTHAFRMIQSAPCPVLSI